MVSRREGQLQMKQSISGQCKMRTGNCRLQTSEWGKMKTEGKNTDCRLFELFFCKKKYLLVGASGMLWTGQWVSE